jgi:hypothetical protein
MSRRPSIDLINKVIEKLNHEFDFNLKAHKVKIVTYNGSPDAGAYRWFTIGISPEIHSDCTLSAFLKAKNVSYSYYSWGNEGVDVTNEKHKENSFMGLNCKSEKPRFEYES